MSENDGEEATLIDTHNFQSQERAEYFEMGVNSGMSYGRCDSMFTDIIEEVQVEPIL